jgi:hypothetical protein
MNAICLITYIPNKIWCDFLKTFDATAYDVFVVVDNNDFDLSCFIAEHGYVNNDNNTNITFVQLDNKTCSMRGYINTNFTLNKTISGWDKALCYFGPEKNNNYDRVWFIEDDVFFYNMHTLKNIDSRYSDDDLLSKCYDKNTDGEKKTWHWKTINIQQYSPPYYNGMMCAVRISKKLIKCINDYASRHKTLFFLEALFPTIAIKNNLKYSTPDEFVNIHYRQEVEKKHINETNLYHPVKNVERHTALRNEMDILHKKIDLNLHSSLISNSTIQLFNDSTIQLK